MNRFTIFTLVILSLFFQNCSVLKEKGLSAESFTPIKYADSICYSRGISVKGNIVYTANSNGKIYSHNLKSGKNSELNKETHLEELRDISIVNKFIYGLQSGTTGKLIEISPKNEIRILEFDFWKGVFLDAMDFYNQTGFIMGDPVDNKFSLFFSKDEGKTWNRCKGEITSMKGEAGYAASGTTVQVLNDSTFIFVSGGSVNRFFKSTDYGVTWSSSIIPFNTGEVIGAFSVCFINNLDGVTVGGDHSKPLNSAKTCFYTSDGGITWNESFSGLTGFKSCVYSKNGVYYSCGTSGLDYSLDKGKNWTSLSKSNYFTMTSDKHFLYLSAPKSTIIKFKLIK